MEAIVSAGKLPWFKFYVSDWLASTKIAGMTPEDEGAYIHLLCHQWHAEQCRLPNDDAVLARLSRLGDRWNDRSCFVRQAFAICSNDGAWIRNDRLFKEWEKQRAVSEKNATNGVKSGAARRLRNKRPFASGSTKREPNANQSESETDNRLQSDSHSVTKGARGGKSPSSSADVDFPAGMDTPEVRAALDRWLAYKRERGDSYKSPAGPAALLAKFARECGQGAAVAFCEAVELSIAQNWRGCFPRTEVAHGVGQFSHSGRGSGTGAGRRGARPTPDGVAKGQRYVPPGG